MDLGPISVRFWTYFSPPPLPGIFTFSKIPDQLFLVRMWYFCVWFDVVKKNNLALAWTKINNLALSLQEKKKSDSAFVGKK